MPREGHPFCFDGVRAPGPSTVRARRPYIGRMSQGESHHRAPGGPGEGRDPRVSVVMACRDALPYLPECLDSLVAQTFTSWELIVVDGASTDGSADLARSYGPRVTVVSAPDRPPPGEARNRGAALARAPLLAFLDADDRWRADKLERQLRRLEAGGAVLSFSDCRVVDGAGRVLGRYLRRHRPRGGAVARSLTLENFVPLSTVVVTREAFRAVGGFPAGYRTSADYVFALSVAELGSFDFDPEPLADYRVHPGSLTRDFRLAYAENVRVYESILGRGGARSGAGDAAYALAVLYWRWALREAVGGGVRRALELAGKAVGAAGPAKGGGALASALRSWSRGLPLRLRMARARAGHGPGS